jgi:hypothetical protein
MKRLLILLVLAACESHPRQDDAHITAANLITQRYSQSRLARWNVRATAAGDGCDVLFIRSSVIMTDSMVEAMHYGAEPYSVYRGGVQLFSRERAFRGVTYKDSSGRLWTYGALSAAEAARLGSCH